jgi:hypothetical protein
MDATCYDTLYHMNLANIKLIGLEELEKDDIKLLTAKKNRSLVEYYFTCTPSLPLYILNMQPDIDMITYLDADLFFFSSLEPIFNEMGNSSILIIPHRFPLNLKHLERCGIYNVGFLSFKRDESAINCLRWWKDRCIEWCYDRCENDRFADQKYLDNWHSYFQNVHVLNYKGAGLAPWNISKYKLDFNSSDQLIEDDILIFFHFHALKKINKWVYNTHLSAYKAKLSNTIKKNIYCPYICEMVNEEKKISSLDNKIQNDSIRSQSKGLLKRLHGMIQLAREIHRGDLIFLFRL